MRLTRVYRARILAAAGSVDYLIFSLLAYFVIERYGRRRVVMCSAAACSLCLTVISIIHGLSETGQGDSYNLGAVATTFFCLFCLFQLRITRCSCKKDSPPLPLSPH